MLILTESIDYNNKERHPFRISNFVLKIEYAFVNALTKILSLTKLYLYVFLSSFVLLL